MGYSTKFEGSLQFTHNPTVKEISYIKSMFWLEGDYSGWDISKGKPHYIQFKLTDGLDGIEWDGSEKFYQTVEAVNFIIANTKSKYPEFGLSGDLLAQGEELDDRWILKINDEGWAEKHKIPVTGKKIECPHCRNWFLSEAQDRLDEMEKE